MKKHIKLFEEFEHTHQEHRQMEDKWIEILKEKSVPITLYNKYGGRDETYSPEIRVWSGNDGLNGKPSYNIDFKNGSNQLLSVSIHQNNPHQINIWKDSGYMLDNENISKLIRMVNDASNYVGNPDLTIFDQQVLRLDELDRVHIQIIGSSVKKLS
tara:strand:+ start:10361 stop:10828 length:468 start_codon:yes stop_codon:yes gene_type:complete